MGPDVSQVGNATDESQVENPTNEGGRARNSINPALAAIALGLAAGSIGTLFLPKPLNIGEREYSRNVLWDPNFKALPTVEAEALRTPVYDSQFHACVSWDVKGTTSLSKNFQYIGDVSFLKGISLKAGSSSPDYNAYTVDGSKENWGVPTFLIEAGNDPIKLDGTHAKVHFVGHFAEGGRTRGGIWYGDTEQKANGMISGSIIVVDYLKVLQKD